MNYVLLEVALDLQDFRWWERFLGFEGLERTKDDEFRTVEWRYIQPRSYCELRGMKTEEVKGSDQPPTKVGLDDQRTEEKKEKDAEDGMTDKVMEHQAKDHEVQRT